MTREEAKEALSVLKIYDNQWLREAVDMAIEALSEPSGNIISRDNAIREVYCLKCKHKDECSQTVLINANNKIINFCSYGERKGGEE